MPPVGEPPLKPVCTPAFKQRSAGAVNVTVVPARLSLQTSKAVSKPSWQERLAEILLKTKIRHKSGAVAVITVPEKLSPGLDAGPNIIEPPIPDPEAPSYTVKLLGTVVPGGAGNRLPTEPAIIVD